MMPIIGFALIIFGLIWVYVDERLTERYKERIRKEYKEKGLMEPDWIIQ